jgi:hypothetical protein
MLTIHLQHRIRNGSLGDCRRGLRLICAVAEATRHRRELDSSIRRRDWRRIIGEWAFHRQDGIFGTHAWYSVNFVIY